MSRIRIKNFGPIKEGYQDNDGWIDIKKVTVFIGNQGSGKSTVAKVISTLTWLEKAINRGDVKERRVHKAAFLDFFEYQRIKKYFRPDTEIDYEGHKLTIKYRGDLNEPINITNAQKHVYQVPKIMYVPAERNFLSVVRDAYNLTGLPDTLYTFAAELRKGLFDLADGVFDNLNDDNDMLRLPIGKVGFKYDLNSETSYIVGDDFKLDLLESSSGYQSLVPLFLVTKFLSEGIQGDETKLRKQLSSAQSVRRNKEIVDVMFDDSLTEVEKNQKVKEIDARYINTCFINIVEEPEQNLFPSSQKEMLYSLLKYNNANEWNKLIVTTHSPYLINYLTLSIKAHSIYSKTKSASKKKKISAIVPVESQVAAEDVIIYEMDEKKGVIKKLGTYNGLPSDENELNEWLEKGNDYFADLLEIEQGL